MKKNLSNELNSKCKKRLEKRMKLGNIGRKYGTDGNERIEEKMFYMLDI